MRSSSFTDRTWYLLIDTSLAHRARIEKIRNQRFARHSYYMCRIVRDLAADMVNCGLILPWPAGFRRLATIQEEARLDFIRIYGKNPLDE